MQNTLIKKLDLDFYENVILLNSLKNQEYLSSIVEFLKPDFFNDKDIKIIFSSISEFFRERGVTPTHTEIKARLVTEDEKSAFNNIVNKLKQLDKEYEKQELLSNTERFLKERCLQKAIIDTAEKFSKGGVDVSEVLQEFERANAITLSESMGHWYFENIDNHIKDLCTIYNPIPLGWKFIDERLEGGLYPKTLTCILGQVNVGKSVFLGNIATNLVMQNRNVLLISLEMSEFMYSKRISSQLTQIPHNQLKTYTDELKESVEHIRSKLEGKLVIKEYPPKSINCRHIDAYITKLTQRNFRPEVVVIDYINLIKPMSKNLNSYESVKEVSEHLRALSFKYNIPIVTASQLKRDAFNTSNPGMEGVSESIGLANTCDVMCSIWQEDEDKELGVIHMGLIKNRFGPNFGSCAFRLKYDTLTLSETNPDYFAPDNTETAIEDASTALDKLADI
jgi:replicative DNA helicase